MVVTFADEQPVGLLLPIRSQSLLSPSDLALNQPAKGCRLAMQGAILFAKENKESRAANEKQKQKRTRSRRLVPAEEGLLILKESAVQPRTRPKA